MTSIPMPPFGGRLPDPAPTAVEHVAHDLVACARWRWNTSDRVDLSVRSVFRDERGPMAPPDRPACDLVWFAMALLIHKHGSAVERWYLDPRGAHVMHVQWKTPAARATRFEAEKIVMSLAIAG